MRYCEIVKEHCLDWPMRGQHPKNVLHLLAARDTVTAQSAVQWLLESKQCQVDERDGEAMTALHIAAAADNLAMCQLLLYHGADPLLEDEEGRYVRLVVVNSIVFSDGRIKK